MSNFAKRRIATYLASLAFVALLGASDPHADAQYFSGTWICGGSTQWTFAPLAGGWTEITYGPSAKPYGTAIMGYVDALGRWIYRDFHADGSYADLTAEPPHDGRWVWSGPYYPGGADHTLNGRVTYLEVDPKRYDRTFESLESGAYVKKGGDSCVKSP